MCGDRGVFFVFSTSVVAFVAAECGNGDASFAVRRRCSVVGNEAGRFAWMADVELDLFTGCTIACGYSPFVAVGMPVLVELRFVAAALLLVNAGTMAVDVPRLLARISFDRALRKLLRTTDEPAAPAAANADEPGRELPTLLLCGCTEEGAISRGELVALLTDGRRLLFEPVVVVVVAVDAVLLVFPCERRTADNNMGVGLRKRLTADMVADGADLVKASCCCLLCCAASAFAVFAALFARTVALYRFSDSCEAVLFDRMELCIEPPSESTDKSTSDEAPPIAEAVAVATASTPADWGRCLAACAAVPVCLPVIVDIGLLFKRLLAARVTICFGVRVEPLSLDE